VGRRQGVQPTPNATPSSGAGQPDAGEPVHADVALQRRDQAEERQAEQHGEGPRDSVHRCLVQLQQRSEAAQRRPGGHEHR